MSKVTHRIYGEAQIIAREGNRITIKYDKTGKEAVLLFPDSFTIGMFRLDDALQSEVDVAVKAKREAERVAREEARVQANIPSKTAVRRAKSTNTDWTTTVTRADSSIRDEFETYLIREGYKELTPSDSPSTVPQYMRAVESVLAEEHLTWSALEEHISALLSLYGEGGDKEDLGNKSNKTWINALRRFNDFLR